MCVADRCWPNLATRAIPPARTFTFILMDGASVLGSLGLPYTIDHFYLAGKLSKQQFDAAKGVEGDWSRGLSTPPMLRKSEFPLDMMVVNF